MKINDTSVTGVFVYTDNAIFEENDFVIFENTIYICKPVSGITEVSGENPKSSKNYIVYLGDQSTNISEYLNFLETGEGENKYISTLTLQQVLNSFILGPDGKGIIGDSIVCDPEGNYKLSNGTQFKNPNSVLSDIMNHPDINHALFKVSRLLPEIIVYVGQPLNQNEDTEDIDGCLLRQYTYLSEKKHKIRIQELIDPIDGLIYYRGADIEVDKVTSSNNFKCAISNPDSLKKKADNIFALYNSRLKVLRSLEEHLKENFRYRKIDVQGKNNFLFIPGLGEYKPEITIMITDYDSDKKIRYNSEASFSLADYTEEVSYGIGGSYKLRVLISSDQSVNIYLETLSGISTSPSKVWISGAYYREYYDL